MDRTVSVCLSASVLIAASGFAWMCVSIAKSVHTVSISLAAVPAIIDERIATEGDLTRRAAAVEIRQASSSVLAEVRQARADLLRETRNGLTVVREEAVTAKGDILRRVDAALAVVDKSSLRLDSALNNAISSGKSEVRKLSNSYASIPLKIGERLDIWTECKGNGACWQAQLTAALGAGRVTLGETSRTMRTVREVTPSIAGNVDKTTANIERFTRPDKWYMKLLKMISPAAWALKR